jgi:tetratricopeptide (TPR) repeat protein
LHFRDAMHLESNINFIKPLKLFSVMNSKLENIILLSAFKEALNNSNTRKSFIDDTFDNSCIEKEKEPIRLIQERIRSEPNNINNYLELTDIYLQNNDNYERAIDTLITALDIIENSKSKTKKQDKSKIYDSLSQTHEKIGNLVVALDYHTKSLKLKEERLQPQDYFKQAKLYQKTKQKGKAIRYFYLYIDEKVKQIDHLESNPKKRDYIDLLDAYTSILTITDPIKDRFTRENCIEDLKTYLPRNIKAQHLVSRYNSTQKKNSLIYITSIKHIKI